MKRLSRMVSVSVWLLALAGAASVWAQGGKVVAIKENGEGEENEAAESVRIQIPMEKATYLGIMSAPVSEAMASQLGLTKGTGLVVTFVDTKGPAAGKLEVNDVLQKLNDQVLFNQQQLTSLIRTFKAGDEVTLTVLRAGKPITVTAKLAEKETPKVQVGGGWGMVGGGAGAPVSFSIGAGGATEPSLKPRVPAPVSNR